MKSCNFWTWRLIFFILRYFAYNMMYYRISKNEKNLFFGKKIAQVWAVTLTPKSTTPGLWSTGNMRKYQQIDVYIY